MNILKSILAGLFALQHEPKKGEDSGGDGDGRGAPLCATVVVQ